MTKNTKTFIASLFLTAFFVFGINIFSKGLTNIFLLNELAKNPSILAAQVSQPSLNETPAQKPVLKSGAVQFKTNARAALSLFVGNSGKTKTLFQKDSNTPFPIASITKLMTALVAMNHYALADPIAITKQAVDKEENIGNFKVGQIFTVQSLLRSMLIESSNDAAEALSNKLGNTQFLNFMNLEAQNMGLQKTFFADSSGVDPNNPNGPINVSSARDLATLTQYIKEYDPQIFDILSLREYKLYMQDGTFHHIMQNTDELLGNVALPVKVLAGKTGWTPQAKGNLLLIAENSSGYFIHVLLGSDNRFDDMKNLLNWVAQSYDF